MTDFNGDVALDADGNPIYSFGVTNGAGDPVKDANGRQVTMPSNGVTGKDGLPVTDSKVSGFRQRQSKPLSKHIPYPRAKRSLGHPTGPGW